MADRYLNKMQLKWALEKCLQCKNKPCSQACPIGCEPKDFIQKAREGDFKTAVQIIQKHNPLGEICGLVCPNRFCLNACTRGHIDSPVPIPQIQATLMALYRKNEEKNIPPSGIFNKQDSPLSWASKLSVAVVGSGPAGLMATHTLLTNGFQVHLFETTDKLGGSLNLIPPERLPRSIICFETEAFTHHPNCTIHLNTPISTPEELFPHFDGVVWAVGEQNISRLDIEGEENTLSFIDYLREPTQYVSAQRIAIIGGGNVALDCALTAHKSGAKHIELFVRRRLCDMRISLEDYALLLQKEINISPLTHLKAIKQEENALTLYLCKNHYFNHVLTPIDGTDIALKGFDLIITAIGSYAKKQKEHERVVFVGDCKTGSSSVVEALKSGFDETVCLINTLFKIKKN